MDKALAVNPTVYGQAVNQAKLDMFDSLASALIDDLPSVDQDFLHEYLTEGHGVSLTPDELDSKFSPSEINLINIHRMSHMRAFLPRVIAGPGVARAYLRQLGYNDEDTDYLIQSGTLMEEICKSVVYGV